MEVKQENENDLQPNENVAEGSQCPNCIKLSQIEKQLKEVLQDHERIKKELEELKRQYMMGNAANGMLAVGSLLRVKDEPASPVPRSSPPISPQLAAPQVLLPEAPQVLLPEAPQALLPEALIPEESLPNELLMEPEAGPSGPRSSSPKRRRSKRKSAKVTNPLPVDAVDSLSTVTRSSRRLTRSSSTGGRDSCNSTRSRRSRLSLPSSTTSGRTEMNENQAEELGDDQLNGRGKVAAVPETLVRESVVDDPVPVVPVVVKPEPVSPPVANRRGNKRRSSRNYNGINGGHETGGNSSGQQNDVQQNGGHSSGQQNGGHSSGQQNGSHSINKQNGGEETSRKRIMFSWASKRIKKEEPEESEEEEKKPIIPLPIPIKPEPDDYVPSLPSPTHSWELMSGDDDTFPGDDNDDTFPGDDNDDTFPGDQHLLNQGVHPLLDPLDRDLDATDSQETIVDASEPSSALDRIEPSSAHVSSSLDRIIAQVAKEGPPRRDREVREKHLRRTGFDENLEHTNFRRLSKRPFDLHAQKVEIGTVSIPFSRVSISKSAIIITGVLTKIFKKTTSYGDLPTKIRDARIQINLQRTCRPTYSFLRDDDQMDAIQSTPSATNHSGIVFQTDLMEDVSRKLASRHIASDPPITVLEASQIKITCSSLLDLDTFIDVLHEQGKKLTKVSDAQSQRRSHPYGDAELDIKPDIRRIKLEAGMVKSEEDSN